MNFAKLGRIFPIRSIQSLYLCNKNEIIESCQRTFSIDLHQSEHRAYDAGSPLLLHTSKKKSLLLQLTRFMCGLFSYCSIFFLPSQRRNFFVYIHTNSSSSRPLQLDKAGPTQSYASRRVKLFISFRLFYCVHVVICA